MLLVDLPHQLALDILREWATPSLKDLSALDVAHCSRLKRTYWLFLLRNYHSDDEFTSKQLAAQGYGRNTLGLVRWIELRGLKISSLAVNVCRLDAFVAHAGVFPTIEKLSFPSPPVSADVEPNLLRILLLSCFPRVNSLDLSRWATLRDRELQVLCGLDLTLKSLNMRNLQFVSSASICAMLRRHSGPLRELTCGANNDVVAALSQTCPQLTALDITCDGVDSSEEFVKMLTRHSLLLRLEVALSCNSAVGADLIDDATVTAMTVCCPSLQHLSISSNFAATEACLSPIMENCRGIRYLELKDWVLQFQDSRGGVKTCSMTYSDGLGCLREMAKSVLPLLERLQCALVVFGDWSAPPTPLSAAALALLTTKFGATVEELSCALADDVSGDFAVSTVLRCANLRRLKLASNLAQISAEFVATLPRFCPQLTCLDLQDPASISDAAAVAMLRGFHGKRLQHLCLGGRQLSDVTLRHVAELAPALRTLRFINNTRVSRFAVLDLLKRNQLSSTLIRFGHHSDTEWVKQQLGPLRIAKNIVSSYSNIIAKDRKFGSPYDWVALTAGAAVALALLLHFLVAAHVDLLRMVVY